MTRARGLAAQPITLYASAARTATPAASSIYRGIKSGYRGVLVVINVTALAATPSVVFTVESNSGDAGTWTADLASAAVTAVGTSMLLCHPDAPDRANVSENTSLGDKWRVKAVHGDADSITYSVLAYQLP